MKRTTLLFIVFILWLYPVLSQNKPGENVVASGIPEIPATLIERTNQYLNIRAASFTSWNPDGKGMYITTRFGNTAQIHFVETPGGARRQLTFFDEPVSSALADPRPGRNGFLFSKDIGGGEFYQIFSFNRATGTWSMLTDGKSRNEGMHWSRAGRYISYSSNRRNKKDTDLWIMDPDAPASAWNLTDREGAWYGGDWSPDESRVIAVHYVSANESHPYIADLKTKSLTSIEADTSKKASYENAVWSADGKTIYYTSDEAGEFQSLFAYDVATGKRKSLLPALAWDVEQLAIARDGRHLAYTVNEDGISTLHVHELPSMRPVPVSGLPAGVIGSVEFDPAGGRIAIDMNAATGPGDVFVVDVNRRRAEQWTFSEVGGLDTRFFISPTLVHYPTFDMAGGKPRMIPAFVYLPRNAKGKTPVIIDIHGGPEGQSRPWFSSIYQYWLNELGCAVVVPNVRGSTGYGKTYLALDNGFNREHSVRDIGALLDWIAAQPNLDATRIAVHGGSYGGYMVLACLTHYSDRIRCGVDVVGISNFVTFLENTESYRRDLRRVEYGDERDPAMRQFLTSISPNTNASNIHSALFVAQGENDPRVPAGEARQIISAVSAGNVPVWSMFAKDEGHGFRKKTNRDYFMRAVMLFFEQYLLK